MHSRVIWLTAFLFAGVHFAISIGGVLLAAVTSDIPEWGMAIAACLTTFPLADVYDRFLDKSGIPILVQLGIPILIGAVIYGALGAGVGWGIYRIKHFPHSG